MELNLFPSEYTLNERKLIADRPGHSMVIGIFEVSWIALVICTSLPASAYPNVIERCQNRRFCKVNAIVLDEICELLNTILTEN